MKVFNNKGSIQLESFLRENEDIADNGYMWEDVQAELKMKGIYSLDQLAATPPSVLKGTMLDTTYGRTLAVQASEIVAAGFAPGQQANVRNIHEKAQSGAFSADQAEKLLREAGNTRMINVGGKQVADIQHTQRDFVFAPPMQQKITYHKYTASGEREEVPSTFAELVNRSSTIRDGKNAIVQPRYHRNESTTDASGQPVQRFYRMKDDKEVADDVMFESTTGTFLFGPANSSSKSTITRSVELGGGSFVKKDPKTGKAVSLSESGERLSRAGIKTGELASVENARTSGDNMLGILTKVYTLDKAKAQKKDPFTYSDGSPSAIVKEDGTRYSYTNPFASGSNYKGNSDKGYGGGERVNIHTATTASLAKLGARVAMPTTVSILGKTDTVTGSATERIVKQASELFSTPLSMPEAGGTGMQDSSRFFRASKRYFGGVIAGNEKAKDNKRITRPVSSGVGPSIGTRYTRQGMNDDDGLSRSNVRLQGNDRFNTDQRVVSMLSSARFAFGDGGGYVEAEKHFVSNETWLPSDQVPHAAGTIFSKSGRLPKAMVEGDTFGGQIRGGRVDGLAQSFGNNQFVRVGAEVNGQTQIITANYADQAEFKTHDGRKVQLQGMSANDPLMKGYKASGVDFFNIHPIAPKSSRMEAERMEAFMGMPDAAAQVRHLFQGARETGIHTDDATPSLGRWVKGNKRQELRDDEEHSAIMQSEGWKLEVSNSDLMGIAGRSYMADPANQRKIDIEGFTMEASQWKALQMQHKKEKEANPDAMTDFERFNFRNVRENRSKDGTLLNYKMDFTDTATILYTQGAPLGHGFGEKGTMTPEKLETMADVQPEAFEHLDRLIKNGALSASAGAGALRTGLMNQQISAGSFDPSNFTLNYVNSDELGFAARADQMKKDNPNFTDAQIAKMVLLDLAKTHGEAHILAPGETADSASVMGPSLRQLASEYKVNDEGQALGKGLDPVFAALMGEDVVANLKAYGNKRLEELQTEGFESAMKLQLAAAGGTNTTVSGLPMGMVVRNRADQVKWDKKNFGGTLSGREMENHFQDLDRGLATGMVSQSVASRSEAFHPIRLVTAEWLRGEGLDKLGFWDKMNAAKEGGGDMSSRDMAQRVFDELTAENNAKLGALNPKRFNDKKELKRLQNYQGLIDNWRGSVDEFGPEFFQSFKDVHVAEGTQLTSKEDTILFQKDFDSDLTPLAFSMPGFDASKYRRDNRGFAVRASATIAQEQESFFKNYAHIDSLNSKSLAEYRNGGKGVSLSPAQYNDASVGTYYAGRAMNDTYNPMVRELALAARAGVHLNYDDDEADARKSAETNITRASSQMGNMIYQQAMKIQDTRSSNYMAFEQILNGMKLGEGNNGQLAGTFGYGDSSRTANRNPIGMMFDSLMTLTQHAVLGDEDENRKQYLGVGRKDLADIDTAGIDSHVAMLTPFGAQRAGTDMSALRAQLEDLYNSGEMISLDTKQTAESVMNKPSAANTAEYSGLSGERRRKLLGSITGQDYMDMDDATFNKEMQGYVTGNMADGESSFEAMSPLSMYMSSQVGANTKKKYTELFSGEDSGMHNGAMLKIAEEMKKARAINKPTGAKEDGPTPMGLVGYGNDLKSNPILAPYMSSLTRIMGLVGGFFNKDKDNADMPALVPGSEAALKGMLGDGGMQFMKSGGLMNGAFSAVVGEGNGGSREIVQSDGKGGVRIIPNKETEMLLGGKTNEELKGRTSMMFAKDGYNAEMESAANAFGMGKKKRTPLPSANDDVFSSGPMSYDMPSWGQDEVDAMGSSFEPPPWFGDDPVGDMPLNSASPSASTPTPSAPRQTSVMKRGSGSMRRSGGGFSGGGGQPTGQAGFVPPPMSAASFKQEWLTYLDLHNRMINDPKRDDNDGAQGDPEVQKRYLESSGKIYQGMAEYRRQKALGFAGEGADTNNNWRGIEKIMEAETYSEGVSLLFKGADPDTYRSLKTDMVATAQIYDSQIKSVENSADSSEMDIVNAKGRAKGDAAADGLVTPLNFNNPAHSTQMNRFKARINKAKNDKAISQGIAGNAKGGAEQANLRNITQQVRGGGVESLIEQLRGVDVNNPTREDRLALGQAQKLNSMRKQFGETVGDLSRPEMEQLRALEYSATNLDGQGVVALSPAREAQKARDLGAKQGAKREDNNAVMRGKLAGAVPELSGMLEASKAIRETIGTMGNLDDVFKSFNKTSKNSVQAIGQVNEVFESLNEYRQGLEKAGGINPDGSSSDAFYTQNKGAFDQAQQYGAQAQQSVAREKWSQKFQNNASLSEDYERAQLRQMQEARGSSGARQRASGKYKELADQYFGEEGTVKRTANEAVGVGMRAAKSASSLMFSSMMVRNQLINPMAAEMDAYQKAQAGESISRAMTGTMSFDEMDKGSFGDLRRRMSNQRQFALGMGEQVDNVYGGLGNIGGRSLGRAIGAAQTIATPMMAGAMMGGAIGGPMGGLIGGGAGLALGVGAFGISMLNATDGSRQAMQQMAGTKLNADGTTDNSRDFLGSLNAGASMLSEAARTGRSFDDIKAEKYYQADTANVFANGLNQGGISVANGDGGFVAQATSINDMVNQFSQQRGLKDQKEGRNYAFTALKAQGLEQFQLTEEQQNEYATTAIQRFGNMQNFLGGTGNEAVGQAMAMGIDINQMFTGIGKGQGVAASSDQASTATLDFLQRAMAADNPALFLQSGAEKSGYLGAMNVARTRAGMSAVNDTVLGDSGLQATDAYRTSFASIDTRASQFIENYGVTQNTANAAKNFLNQGDFFTADALSNVDYQQQSQMTAAQRGTSGSQTAIDLEKGMGNMIAYVGSVDKTLKTILPAAMKTVESFQGLTGQGFVAPNKNYGDVIQGYGNAAAFGISAESVAAGQRAGTGSLLPSFLDQGQVNAATAFQNKLSTVGLTREDAREQSISDIFKTSFAGQSSARRLSGRDELSLDADSMEALLADDKKRASFQAFEGVANSLSASQSSLAGGSFANYLNGMSNGGYASVDPATAARLSGQAQGAIGIGQRMITNGRSGNDADMNMMAISQMSADDFAKFGAISSGDQFATAKNWGMAQSTYNFSSAGVTASNFSATTGAGVTKYGNGAILGNLLNPADKRAANAEFNNYRNSPVFQQMAKAYGVDANSSSLAQGSLGLSIESAQLSAASSAASFAGQKYMSETNMKFMRGGGTIGAQGFVQGSDGLAGAKAAAKQKGYNLNVGNGMGFWQIEDAGVKIGREKQDFQMAQETESVKLGSLSNQMKYNQFFEKFGLNQQQFDYNTNRNRSEMKIGRSQSLSQRSWQQEDMSFSRSQSNLEFGWQMEDSDRNIKYARGKNRVDLMREKDRNVTRFSMGEGQRDKEEDRFKTRAVWEDKQFTREQDHFEKTTTFQKQEMDMSKKHFLESFELEKKQQTMREQSHAKSMAWMMQERALDDQNRLLSRQSKEWEMNAQLTLAAAQAGIAARQAEISKQSAMMAAADALAVERMNKQIVMGPQIQTSITNTMNVLLTKATEVMNVLKNQPNTTAGTGNYTVNPYFGGGQVGVTTPMSMYPGFAAGGHTGYGLNSEIAGIVHKNEYVVPEQGAMIVRGSDPDQMRFYKEMLAVLRDIRDQRSATINATINTRAESIKAKGLINQAYASI